MDEEIKKFTNNMGTSLNPSNDTMNAVRYVRDNLPELFHLAEQSLVQMVKTHLEQFSISSPDRPDITVGARMMKDGILELLKISTPKPKGDK